MGPNQMLTAGWKSKVAKGGGKHVFLKIMKLDLISKLGAAPELKIRSDDGQKKSQPT
jgi:hypothetical protein